ncbi:hypothetical protein QQP08_004370 [Theobroma cacao]|nr:hypothetical protein QQP08_004370 [Theobroma cacao]
MSMLMQLVGCGWEHSITILTASAGIGAAAMNVMITKAKTIAIGTIFLPLISSIYIFLLKFALSSEFSSDN